MRLCLVISAAHRSDAVTTRLHLDKWFQAVSIADCPILACAPDGIMTSQAPYDCAAHKGLTSANSCATCIAMAHHKDVLYFYQNMCRYLPTSEEEKKKQKNGAIASYSICNIFSHMLGRLYGGAF